MSGPDTAPVAPPEDSPGGAPDSGRSERVAGVVLVLAGLGVAAEASTFTVGFMTDPVGPKALPYLSAFVFVVAGALLAWRPGAGPVWPARALVARMAGATAAFLVYAALLAPIGFFTATTAVVGTLSVLFGGPPRKAFAAAALLAAAMWFGFVYGLGLPLPMGALWTR